MLLLYFFREFKITIQVEVNGSKFYIVWVCLKAIMSQIVCENTQNKSFWIKAIAS